MKFLAAILCRQVLAASQPYFEVQTEPRCGMHALNHIGGGGAIAIPTHPIFK